MPELDNDDAPDVTPPLVRDLLILAWLLLFGGRWLVFPVLQLLGVLTPEQVAAWDEVILLKLYLVLLAATILIVVLRAVRGAQREPSASRSTSAALPSRGDNIRD